MKGSFAPFFERKENEKNILAFLFLNFIRALVVPITPFLPVGKQPQSVYICGSNSHEKHWRGEESQSKISS
jgi:hypothetical protein